MKTVYFPSNNHFVIQEQDVFLVSYPRSGNTWMRYILANLLHPTLEWNIENLNRVVPDLHQNIPPDYIESQPRIFKSHNTFCSEYPRVIYIYRDGRDISLSYYHLQKNVRNFKREFPDFLLQMLQGKLKFGSWQEHVNSWIFNSTEIPLLAIKYEELCEETVGNIELVAKFLGFYWNIDEIELAIRKSSFEKQKKDFFKYKYDSHWSKGFQGGLKGGAGKWREVFTKELNELFWKYAGEISEKLRYPKY